MLKFCTLRKDFQWESAFNGLLPQWKQEVIANKVGTVTSAVAGDDVKTFYFWINRLFTSAISVSLNTVKHTNNLTALIL